MLTIKDKLPITDQDFQYFKDEWMKTVTPKPFEKHIEISKEKLEWLKRNLDNPNYEDDVHDEQPSYKFSLYQDIITVSFRKVVYRYMGRGTEGPSLTFVKMRQSFKDHDTYHPYNKNTVYDSEVFFMENCKHLQNRLEGVK